MSDPATIVTAAGAALQGLSMVGGAIGGSQEAGASREDAEAVGMAARQQNSRLLQGPGGPPPASAGLQGYGPAPTPGGQYAPIPPTFDDGAAQQEQMMGEVQSIAQGIPPELLQNAALFQQQMMMPPPMAPQQMMGAPQAPPNMFGIPVFNDGPQQPTRPRPAQR